MKINGYKAFLLIVIPITILLLIGSVLLVKPVEKADFSYAMSSEQRSIDPALVTALSESRITRALFEGLITLDPESLTPRPGIAKSWDINSSGRIYEFRLRKSFWSDSTPVTTSDFIYSWERVLNPASKSSYDYMLFALKNGEAYRKGKVSSFDSVGVVALDDSTLRVELETPIPYFLDLVSFETFLPVNKACVEKHGIRWTRPQNIICNGPYILKSHRLNDKLRLIKNRYYWNKGKVNLNIIDIYTCEGINTAFNMYETGVVDLIDDFPTIITEDLLKRPDKMVVPTLGTYFYRFNVQRPPFNNPLVRRAFNFAIDRERLVKFVTKGGEIPAGSLVPPGMPLYSAVSGFSFDPIKARALFAEAGYPNGRNFPDIELLYNTSENHKRVAEAVAYMIKEVLGVNVLPVNLEWKVLLTQVDNFDYQLARAGWYGDYTDPNTFLDMFVTGGGNNRTGWSSAAYDSLINNSSFIVGKSDRMAVMRQAEELLLEDSPILPIYHYVSKFMIKPDIRGLYPNIRSYFNLADIRRE